MHLRFWKLCLTLGSSTELGKYGSVGLKWDGRVMLSQSKRQLTPNTEAEVFCVRVWGAA